MASELEEVIAFINSGRQRYADEWTEGDSKTFERDGHYKWMASFVSEYKFTLEIGTGSGSGTLQLLSDGHKVISIDENTNCLDVAEKKLKESGFRVVRVHRGIISISTKKESSYSIDYSKISLSDIDFDVLLLEGDIYNDPHLIEFLMQQSEFDSVVCWLIGTHYSRRDNDVIDHARMPTPFYYRIHIQNRVYELADVILRSGGVLHIVDRGEPPTTAEMIAGLKASHEDQASVTSLVVGGIETRDYSEPTSGVGMCVTITEHNKNSPKDFRNLCFYSILSSKP